MMLEPTSSDTRGEWSRGQELNGAEARSGGRPVEGAAVTASRWRRRPSRRQLQKAIQRP